MLGQGGRAERKRGDAETNASVDSVKRFDQSDPAFSVNKESDKFTSAFWYARCLKSSELVPEIPLSLSFKY